MPTQADLDQYQRVAAEILKREVSNAESFDRAILTLSSGALAVSLTFLKDFVPLATATGACLLYVSWFLFAICIVSTVASYLVSAPSTRFQLRMADRKYLQGDKTSDDERDIANDIAGYLNLASGVLFCTAVLLTTLFIAINAKESSMSNDGNSEHLKKAITSVPRVSIPDPTPSATQPAPQPVPQAAPQPSPDNSGKK